MASSANEIPEVACCAVRTLMKSLGIEVPIRVRRQTTTIPGKDLEQPLSSAQRALVTRRLPPPGSGYAVPNQPLDFCSKFPMNSPYAPYESLRVVSMRTNNSAFRHARGDGPAAAKRNIRWGRPPASDTSSSPGETCHSPEFIYFLESPAVRNAALVTTGSKSAHHTPLCSGSAVDGIRQERLALRDSEFCGSNNRQTFCSAYCRYTVRNSILRSHFGVSPHPLVAI